jgi:peptidoglycan/xylan/chitin deacetylase (PgdA/CDA1 family)
VLIKTRGALAIDQSAEGKRPTAVGSVLNICFHGIGSPQRELEAGEDAYWVDTDRFTRILDEIAAWPAVRISFDDANSSDVLVALPELLDRAMTAQFFLVAGRLGSPGCLGVGDVRELSAKGMGIGTHGMSHRPWTGMNPAVREAELVTARRLVEDAAGGPVTDAACPLGRYDRRLLADLRRLGYQRVYTSDRAAARPGSWLQPRFSVRREDTPQSLRAALLTQPGLAQRAWQHGTAAVKRMR